MVVVDSESEVTGVTAGLEHLTADFGYNWVSPTDSSNPPSDATGAIGDYIWNDADGDGVQDPGEIGLGGITVTLYYDPDGNGVYDTVYPLNGITTTDDSGHYIFDDIPPGGYVVEVDPTNLPAGWNPVPTGDPDDDGDNTTNPIVVAPGDVYVNADFGYQPTRPGQPILAARSAIKSSSTPMATASKMLVSQVFRVSQSPSLTIMARSLRPPSTDENGTYEFPNLPAGKYTVSVTDTDNVLTGLEPQSDYDGILTPNQSTTTVDGTTDDLDQDFGYVPQDHDAR